MMEKTHLHYYKKLLLIGILMLQIFTSQSQNLSTTLDDFLYGNLWTGSFNGTWIDDNQILFKNEDGNLMIYTIDDNQSFVLMNMTSEFNFDAFEISPNQDYILLSKIIMKEYQTNNSIEYRIIDLSTLNEKLLIVNNSTIHQHATLTPDGKGLIVVHENNIYYFPEIMHERFFQLTKSRDDVVNGVQDPTSNGPSIAFSPSSKYLVFGSFDFSKVKKIDVPFYGNVNDNLSYQYPSSNIIYESKTGSEIPIPQLFYVDLQLVAKSNGKNIKLIKIKQASELANNNTILYTFNSPNDNIIAVSWKNRIQNELYVVTHNIEKSIDKTVFKFFQNNGWISENSDPYFINNATEFLIILPQKQYDNDYWNHLVLVKINETNGKSVMNTLTSGTFVVTKIVGWDEQKSLVYYIATVSNEPSQQHFYRLSLLDINKKPECLSCNIKSENKGIACLYNDASMSPYLGKFILSCNGPDVPHTAIYNSNDSTKIMTWNNNFKVAKLINEKVEPIVMKLKVPITNNFKAEVKLFIPPNADLTGSIKYPLLINVYAGPDSFDVSEEFKVDWGTYLVTNKNYIYAIIDGRGSGRKSNSMLFSVYRNLGTVEIYDQINVTRYLQNKFSFIDEKKTAIWGWSYGGYAAGMTMALDENNIFKCGISVAPVADWRLYKSDYSESYMGLPTLDDNFDGYEQAQLINKIINIKSNSYYLIHGTFDDNVQYQNSLLIANEFEKYNILFQQQLYTNENHGIINYEKHLYLSMEKFLDECLNKHD